MRRLFAWLRRPHRHEWEVVLGYGYACRTCPKTQRGY